MFVDFLQFNVSGGNLSIQYIISTRLYIPIEFHSRQILILTPSHRWFLHALDLYRRMKQKNPSPIENCSPSEVRRLLYQLLCESKMLQLNHKGGEKTEDLQRV